MKKFLLMALSIALFQTLCKAQLYQPVIQAALKEGSAANSVQVVIKSSAAFSGQFTNVQFTLQVPVSVGGQPVLRITNNPLQTFIPTASFEARVSQEGEFYTYLFSAVPLSSAKYQFDAGTELVALELQINSRKAGEVPIRLASLPNGGTTGQNSFYVEVDGKDHTGITEMFYEKEAVNGGGYDRYSYQWLRRLALPNNRELAVFPNPANGTLSVRLAAGAAVSRVQLISAEGKTVLVNEGGDLLRTLDVRRLAAGVYTLQVVGKDKSVQQKKVVLQ